MGSLLVVSGPPGAGKSSVALVLAQRRSRSVPVEGDAFFGFLHSGAVEPWPAESHEQNTIVTQVAAQAASEFARHGYDTVYDGVVGAWFLGTFTAVTGSTTSTTRWCCHWSRCACNALARRTGHGFTDEAAARHMHAEFAGHPLPDRHMFTDPHAERIDSARGRGELRLRLRRRVDR